MQESQDLLEQSLKELLEMILMYMEGFVHTKSDLKQVEQELTDYDDLHGLVNIIKNVFQRMTEKIDKYQDRDKDKQITQQATEPPEEEYDRLEKIVQKYEQDIRNHIKLEQQLKLYAEAIQSKLDESEQERTNLLESTKKLINEAKKENQRLTEQLKQSVKDQDSLRNKLKELDQKDQEQKSQLAELTQLQQKIKVLQDMLKETMMNQLKRPDESKNSSSRIINKTEQSSSNRITQHVGPTPQKYKKGSPNMSSKRGSSEQIAMVDFLQRQAIRQSASSSKENHMDKLYDYIRQQEKDSVSGLQNLINQHIFKSKAISSSGLQQIYGRSNFRRQQYSSEHIIKQKR